jgi:hypothetical protein
VKSDLLVIKFDCTHFCDDKIKKKSGLFAARLPGFL